MATFLFWNLNRKPLKDSIVSLCHEHDVDVLILAESELPDSSLLESLNIDTPLKFHFPFNPSERLRFFIRYPRNSLRPVLDEGGIAIRRFVPPIGLDILLVALHLPSKQYQTESDQAYHATRVAEAIREAESLAGHSRTLILGDVNMNPFEPGVVSSEGLHAVMDRKIALRRSRIVQGRRRDFFL